MFRLTDSQQVNVTLSALTKAGNPAPLQDVTLTSSDETIVQVIKNADNDFTLAATGVLGTAQISAQADVDMGDGVKLLEGMEMVEVVAGEAVQIAMQFGEPSEKP